MTYPLSQTLGAKRQRTWRERAMVEQSHTPNAVRKRAQRAQRARDRYIGTGTTVFPSDKSDYSRAERPCGCCRKVFQPTARRRMLCAACYSKAPGAYVEPVTMGCGL